MSEARVHIVLLNWNGWQDTLECIESLLTQSYKNFQIVVCDNDSKDQSVAQFRSWASGELAAPTPKIQTKFKPSEPAIKRPLPYIELSREQAESGDIFDPDIPLVIINNGGNLGFAGGNNTGLRYALNQGADFCWLLNNDTLVEPNALVEMVQHSTELKRQGIKNSCGSIQFFYDDPDIVQCIGGFSFNPITAVSSNTFGRYMKRSELSDIDHASYRNKLDAIHGCSWLLPRDFLEQIGLMDERYFLYFEEIDWATRAQGQFELTYAQNAFIYHKEGQSIGSKSIQKTGSLLSEFYCNYNKFVYAKKFSPWTIPTVFAYTLLQAANHLRKRQPDKAWMQFKVAFGKNQYP